MIVYKETKDNWMGNYRTDDHRCPNLVKVTLTGLSVVISGNDDFAVIKSYNQPERAVAGFLSVISEHFVNIDEAIKNGFVVY